MAPNPTPNPDRVSTRVDIAILGIRSDAPVRRTGGAGPSDDGHFAIDGLGAALRLDSSSPYVVDPAV